MWKDDYIGLKIRRVEEKGEVFQKGYVAALRDRWILESKTCDGRKETKNATIQIEWDASKSATNSTQKSQRGLRE